MKKEDKEIFRTEIIKKLVSEDWKFRIKKVSGHKYIIGYVGKKEKSLGPFNDNLWALIEDYGGKKAIPRETVSVSRRELETLKNRITTLETFFENSKRKSQKCPQIGSWFGFTYCKAIRWERKPTKLMRLYPNLEFKRIMPDRINKMWHVSPDLDICWTCATLLQIPDRFIDDVNDAIQRLDLLEENKDVIEDTLGLLKSSANLRIRDDNYGCIHIKSNGTCGSWYYSEKLYDREQEQETITRDGKTEEIYRDNVKKNSLICTACPSYKPKSKK